MGLRMSWKVLLGTLGLVGCGGEALEAEHSLGRASSALEGEMTLTLNGAAEVTLECGVGTWVDEGATATDAEGNPLEVITYNSGHDEYGPGPNANAEGIYSVQYSAYDSLGWNVVSAIRTVTVQDTRTPTLTLNGDAEVTHTCGSQFVDPGVTSVDECYGNLAVQAVITGEVNGWVEGTYTLTYSVADGAGHAPESVSRVVHVVDCPVY
jgi:hypothetical protein